jgi:hypothetical protein
MWTLQCTRVIRKVRQTQHQNPEFRHTRLRFKKDLQKSTLAFKGALKLRKPSILVVNWVSSSISFFLSASNVATYIFTALTSTTTIISLEPCERGDRGWKETQRQGEDRVTLWITLLWRSELGKRTWQK